MTPDYLPVIPLDDTTIGAGWRRVSIGETVRAHFEAFILMPPHPGWRLSAFTAADRVTVSGRTHYRAPASLRAWCSVAWPALRKVVARWFKRNPPSP